jgi:alkyl hydroperoxide reductase subunit AhpC
MRVGTRDVLRSNNPAPTTGGADARTTFTILEGTAPARDDGAWCHIAYARESKLKFPLLADFEPKGAVARAYGVYRQQDGTAERALFVIDPEGIIRWSYVSPVGVVPGADGILTALQALTVKEKTA